MLDTSETTRDCIEISRKMKSLYMYIDIDTSAFSLSMECFGHHLGVQKECRGMGGLPLMLQSRRSLLRGVS